MMNNPFNLLMLNPYPIMISINLISLMMNLNLMNKMMTMILFINLISILIKWNKTNSMMFNHKSKMSLNYIINMKIMIYMESMFFLSFFYMHLSMKMFPLLNFNYQWTISSFSLNYYISMMNTMILMNSSITITLMMMKMKNKYLLMTNILASYFSMIQLYEYLNMNFNISNSSFWSIYFSLTSFHSMHVIMGMMMINTNMKNIKNMSNNIQMTKMIIWYWHFVDLIWISIFFMFY